MVSLEREWQEVLLTPLGRHLSTGNRDASCRCQSGPPLGGVEIQASDFNVSSNGRKEKNVGWVCLQGCRGTANQVFCSGRGVSPASFILISFFVCLFERPMINEKVMSFRSSAWLRLVGYLPFIFF